MLLAAIDLFQYRLPLVEAIPLGGEEVAERTGVLVRMKSDGGAMGWGDVAPLPGFSKENLREAARQLLEVRAALQGWAVTPDWIEPEGIFVHYLNGLHLAPSVRFGVELALWSLYAASRQKPLPALFTPHPRPTVALNGLLMGSPAEILQSAAHMREAGYRAVKLKVGRWPVPEEVELVCELSRVVGAGVAIRLDANRAWNLAEAEAFVRGITGVAVDYIEEPLAEPGGLPGLVERYDVPVALDETLIGMSPDAVGGHKYARAAILKPTLLGGVVRTLRLANRVTAMGMTPVLSAAFESGIGVRGLVALAAGLGGDAPVGLDTYRWLADDVLDPRLDLSQGRVTVATLLGARRRIKKPLLRLFDRLDTVSG